MAERNALIGTSRQYVSARFDAVAIAVLSDAQKTKLAVNGEQWK